ncbi:MAG: T9SS type A sorting domain-containing protein [Candidatus Hatepunaea meridiana]|nr:T9SS type A sorting domain-containing protein [Candidatus Hatepunaea meridiana]
MYRSIVLITFLALTFAVGSAFGIEEFKITANDAAEEDYFGKSVCISGDYAVVGAWGNDDDGEESGSAYIFVRDGDDWTQQAKLTANDAAVEDLFGYSVSISGDYAVVGAGRNDDDGNGSGSAYIFVRDGDDWTEQAKLTADDAAADDYFGDFVSIDGDYAVVGAYNNDDDGWSSGSAYIFVRDAEDWTQQVKLTANDAAEYDYFGYSVSIDDDYAVIGARGNDDDGEDSGSAYIFVRDGDDWREQAKLTADDAAARDYFGFSVSISGDYSVVGAYGNNDDGEDSGSAYIFVHDGDNWTEQAKLTANDAAADDYFGHSVSIDGDYAVVGADRNDNDDDNVVSGSAYIFVRDGDDWTQQAKLTANDAADWDFFGRSVSISGDYTVVGADRNDDDGEDSGSAYIFQRDEPDQPENLTWWIHLSATVDNTHDNDNYAGGAEEASFDFDVDFDFPEPPHAPHNYIQLYFPHEDWEDDLGDNFSSDIVADDAQWTNIIVWDFEVNTDAEDQAITLGFDYNEDIDQDFNLVLIDGEEAVDLWENDSYEYNSGEGGVHEFQLVYGDLVVPIVTVTYPNGEENLHPGEQVNITWEAEDLTGVVASVVSYSIDRGETWTEIGSTENDDYEFDWEIPDLYSPYCLIKVECTDVVDNTGVDRSDAFFAITPQTSAFDFVAGWNLISIPLDPEDNSLEALFDDDIENPYHVYDYDQASGFTRVDAIDCGPGYWLGLYDDASLDLDGAAFIDTVGFELNQGWNLLGNPLLWLTPLDSVLFRVWETTYSLEEAVDEELVLPILYNWLATENSYTEEDAFNPWLGYWFAVLAEDIQMLVYPVVPTEEEERDEINEGEPLQWNLTISAAVEDASDLTTTLGVEENATDGFDVRYDFPEPPIPPGGKYVTAYFHHNDWNPLLGRNFNRDIRSDLDYEEQTEWELTIQSSDEEDVTVSWNEIAETIPAEYEIILIDSEAEVTINLLEEESYSYMSTGERRFQIRVTSYNAVKPDPYRGIPTDFAIVSTHPNPFNATTTITYGLPSATDVSLTVYDLSGRKVVTLINGYQSTGYHTAVFNGEGQAAGVYVVRLEAEGFVGVRKVVMVK